MNTGLLLVAASAIVVLAGCGASQEATGADGSTEAAYRFESEFDPSQYNPDIGTIAAGENLTSSGETTVGISNPPPPELVQGFRVQIHASSNIDQVSRQKQLAEEQYPTEWFYLVYDPPTYKLRAGNFLTRFEADRFLKELKEGGFRDSWIVPDKVVQNAGPRQPSTPDAPEE
jgi:hypothetical protein